VKGYAEPPELDSVIQFWLQYWQEAGLAFPKDLDPLLIKVIIAKESSLNPKADPKSKVSSAYGLMRITNRTRRDTKNLNDGIVDLERRDLEDPVISIAMGIRWFSYKFSCIPRKETKNIFNAVRGYYHWDDGEEYAKKVMAMYRASKS
jgi:soluble lytic murein transglycosylase-like protein